MPKDSVKDKLEGNELDLSLSNLTTVPVKEIAAIPKATKLDLSCNLLDSLPESFCSLTQLTRLDLSKNQLTELPADFGNLRNLLHLDLLGNKLEILPVSFENLDKLKWLDVKDNPLEEGLVKAAGDCLDVSQCQLCAKRVVAYMKTVSAELEKRKQIRLKRQKEKEAQKQAKEEQERKRKKAEKIAEKERKKREFENRMKVDSKEKTTGDSEKEKVEEPQINGFHTHTRVTKDERRSGCMCFLNIFAILFIGLLAVTIGVYVNCDVNRKQDHCKNYINPFFSELKNNLDRCFIRVTEYAEHMKTHFYK